MYTSHTLEQLLVVIEHMTSIAYYTKNWHTM